MENESFRTSLTRIWHNNFKKVAVFYYLGGLLGKGDMLSSRIE